MSFNTKFGRLPSNEIEIIGLNSMLRNIIGCEFKHNYRVSEDAMELEQENVDILECASFCLQSKTCQYGWAYHAGNKKVEHKKNLKSLYYIFPILVLFCDGG